MCIIVLLSFGVLEDTTLHTRPGSFWPPASSSDTVHFDTIQCHLRLDCLSYSHRIYMLALEINNIINHFSYLDRQFDSPPLSSQSSGPQIGQAVRSPATPGRGRAGARTKGAMDWSWLIY